MAPVIHQVMLADLNCLAELWEISSDTLGLDINEEGNLVPLLIGANDNATSVAEMSAVAGRDYPDSSVMDIVVQIHRTATAGNRIAVSTLDQLISPQMEVCQSRWWRFTDDYVEQMH